ncbi:MAG: hypothetical protein KC421_27465 [Anaerolineales bacterium]|nr:hypothetical protein [Anaerolineales bacterium]
MPAYVHMAQFAYLGVVRRIWSANFFAAFKHIAEAIVEGDSVKTAVFPPTTDAASTDTLLPA